MVRDTNKVLDEDEINLPYVKEVVKVLTSTNYNDTILNKINKLEEIFYQNREIFFTQPQDGSNSFIARLRASLTAKYFNTPAYHQYFSSYTGSGLQGNPTITNLFPKGDGLNFLKRMSGYSLNNELGNPKPLPLRANEPERAYDEDGRRQEIIKSFMASPSRILGFMTFQSQLLWMKGYYEHLSPATLKNLKDGKLLTQYTSDWEEGFRMDNMDLDASKMNKGKIKTDLITMNRNANLMLAIGQDDFSINKTKLASLFEHFSMRKEDFGYASTDGKVKTRPWDKNLGYDGWSKIKYGMSDHKGEFDIIKNGKLYLIIKIPVKISKMLLKELNNMEFAPATIMINNKGYKPSDWSISPYWMPDKEVKELYDFEVREYVTPLFAKLMGSDYDNPIRPVEVMMINNEINYQYKRLELKYFGDLQGIKLFDENILDGWKLPQKPLVLLNWNRSPFIIEEVKE